MEKPDIAYYAVIPADIRYDPDLKPNAKLLYGELTSLCNSKGYCWATNEYFADLYKLSSTTVSRLISQLEKKGYIRCEMVATNKGSERRIYAGMFLVQKEQRGVDKNDNTHLDESDKRGVDENVKQNNKKIINTPYSPPQGDGVDQGQKGQKRGKREIDWGLFERFWAAYPKKRAKKNAQRAWAKLNPDLELCRRMSAALERDKASRDWLRDGGAYIPYPATWLNGRRWEDEPDPPQEVPRETSQPAPLRGQGVTYL